MSKFTDHINISIRAGKGGPGSVSFRREKYVERGGPDGGDGGRGGDVYFKGSRRHTNLSYFLPNKTYKAKRGESGAGRNMNGAKGEDIILNVPLGTEIKDADTGEVIADIVEDEKLYMIAEGGIGGKGNAFFKSSTNQNPRFSQPGEDGQEFNLELNLKLIADIGLVGLPNAGKSTILAAISKARPKIGAYPFTTLIPNLGVLYDDKLGEFKVADIPGIIEGAHQGLGLGLSFLRHIERVRAIVYVVDIDSDDITGTIELLKEELKSYNEKLLDKKSIIVVNKWDIVEYDETYAQEIRQMFKQEVIFISAKEKKNMDLFEKKLKGLVK